MTEVRLKMSVYGMIHLYDIQEKAKLYVKRSVLVTVCDQGNVLSAKVHTEIFGSEEQSCSISCSGGYMIVYMFQHPQNCTLKPVKCYNLNYNSNKNIKKRTFSDKLICQLRNSHGRNSKNYLGVAIMKSFLFPSSCLFECFLVLILKNKIQQIEFYLNLLSSNIK